MQQEVCARQTTPARPHATHARRTRTLARRARTPHTPSIHAQPLAPVTPHAYTIHATLTPPPQVQKLFPEVRSMQAIPKFFETEFYVLLWGLLNGTTDQHRGGYKRRGRIEFEDASFCEG